MTRKEKRLARTIALQTMYALEQSGTEVEEILQFIGERWNSTIAEDVFIYSRKLIDLSKKWSEPLDEIIKRQSNNWEFNRIAKIDRLILKMALTEMLYIDEIPPKVSICEAVEIAKLFSTDDSGRFVNGILDSVYNEIKDKIVTDS